MGDRKSKIEKGERLAKRWTRRCFKSLYRLTPALNQSDNWFWRSLDGERGRCSKLKDVEIVCGVVEEEAEVDSRNPMERKDSRDMLVERGLEDVLKNSTSKVMRETK